MSGTLADWISRYLSYLQYQRNASEHTLRNYASDLRQFLDYLTHTPEAHQPDYVLVDGRFPLELKIPQQAVIDGDNLCQVISAASIIAKVWRDRYMVRLQEQYPRFSFGQHKGYGTQQHREELRQNGPTPEHRRSFRGVVSS